MSPVDAARLDQALDWARRVADPAFDDWDGHLAWLEIDPANAAAFDEASLLIEEATEGLAPSHHEVPDALASRRKRAGWLMAGAAAIAASLAAIIVWPHQSAAPPGFSMIVTDAGQSRRLSLPDGTRISLNGDTAIGLDRADRRHVRLDHGQAFFTVVHDERHPFSVTVGTDEVTDVGTAFDVTRDKGHVVVAVREGAVLYRSPGDRLELHAGMAMREGPGLRLVSSVDPAAVGGWAAGRLSYRDASLAVVAGDLSRIVGAPVVIDPAIADRRISGVFMTDGDRGRMMQRIGSILGIAIHKDGLAWRMSPLTQ